MSGATLDPPEAAAKAARLRYVSDASPGITRKRSGERFRYIAANGSAVRDAATLDRIRALAIPPAWTDVWICPVSNGHIQATGRDARGRKQYRYHDRWRAARDETKFGRLAAFGRALPRIRARLDSDLRRPGLPREKALAAVVRLLDTSHIRIGNEEYVRANRHYGLTTLRNRHADVSGARIRFRFTGKSGQKHTVELRDRRLARIVRKCQDLPGQELFEYLDDGEAHPIRSDDVNAYLREISGEDFTAKDFRTWAGSVLAAEALAALGPADTAQAKRNVVEVVDTVAGHLGNTRAVCRKGYIHPRVLDGYLTGRCVAPPAAPLTGLSPEETALLDFLENDIPGK
jgi:DNA topoisomerase-1